MHHDAKPDLITPLLISAVIIVAFAAAGAYLAFAARAPGQVARGDVAPGGKVVLPAGEKHTVRGLTDAAERAVQEKIRARRAFAAQLQRRYGGRGMPVAATVTGEDLRVFTLRWTQEPGAEQQRQMAHAEPLWDELRKLGCRRVEMLDHRSDEKLWYKDL